MTIIGENGWLGTRPIFYHEKTGAASEDIHSVIDLRTLEFDADGLRDYLDFGYCVFGRTPIRHVRYAAHCTRLLRDSAGGIHEERRPDPTLPWDAIKTQPVDVIDQLRSAVRRWERTTEKGIVLPLSGGFDSRFLASFLEHSTPVRAFTYGISDDPERSTEVTIARQVAQRLKIRWEQIQFRNFHVYLDPWDDLFGPATHAHGMYHFDFFSQIAERLGGPFPLLSGVVGDAWAGSIAPVAISSAADLSSLGYTHGLHARQLVPHIHGDGRWRTLFWQHNRDKLTHPKFQIVEIIRLKMMLLRYLLRLPVALGFEPWSPFTDCAFSMSMVCLPEELRRDRKWQRDYFEASGLNPSDHTGSRQNSLDLRTTERFPPPPLDVSRLAELFDRRAIDAINRVVCRPSCIEHFGGWMQTFPRGAGVARKLRMSNPIASAYAAYLTLRPLDQLLARRNAA